MTFMPGKMANALTEAIFTEAMKKGSPRMTQAALKVGKIGRSGSSLSEAALIKSGQRRITGVTMGIGALGILGRSSGANGLQTRSSAPMPRDPYGGY